MAAYLEAYRVAQDDLFGRVQLSSRPQLRPIQDDTISDGASSDTDCSSSDVLPYDAELPGLRNWLHLYFLFSFSCFLGAMEFVLAYMSGNKDEASVSSSYMATKWARLTDDDTMIVDCGATKHCIPATNQC